MPNIVPANSGLTPRSTRGASRALAQLDARTEFGLARIESEADLQVGRVQAVAYVGKRAMHEVAMVSQLEQQLAALVPLATPRLQAIGDMVALQAADLVADTIRRVGR